MKNQTIDAKLLFAQNLIENGKNVESILSQMKDYGYDAKTIEEGRLLLIRANDLQVRQKAEYGEQFAATDELSLARANANKDYMKHVKLARIALKDNRGAFEALQLNGERRQSMSGWVQQAKTFYANALDSEELQHLLSKFTITQQTLEAGSKAIAEVEQKLNKQLKEKGEAQSATLARDAAFDQLQEWTAQYIAIARIALENEPQLLEILGLIEPS